MKRITAVFIALICMLLWASPAVLAASEVPIVFDDFTFCYGNKEVNILTENLDAVMLASGKKVVKIKTFNENDYGYAIKTKTATFYMFARDTVYSDGIEFTSKGTTARGIKIGSKESALLAVYPEPMYKDEYEKHINYSFRASAPKDGITDSDIAHLDAMRPIYYYAIHFEVSKKTHKVTKISIMQDWWG